MSTQYSGFKLDPVPEQPTKKQALDALDALGPNLRYEYVSYYKQIVRHFINSIKEDNINDG